MAVQLFKLKGVPDDEAEDIRNLLTKHNIDYYETPAGNWGISMPAIWLNKETQLLEAKSLINKYQDERLVKTRDEYELRKKEGRHRTIMSELLESPVRFILYIALAAVILYLSAKPFMHFGQ